jgi:protein SCO1/2
VLLALLFALTPAASADETGQAAPRLPDEASARQYFTDSELLTQDGQRVRFYSEVLADHVVVINGFCTTCTGLSPRQSLVLEGLQELLGESLGRDVRIVSLTVDPATDTVDKLARYARTVSARPGWIFLTGEPVAMDRTSRKLGMFVERPEDHSGLYLLGNVRTGLWMKAPLHAQSRDLYFQVQRLLRDQGEPAPD